MSYQKLDDFPINLISDERQDIVRMLGTNDSSYLDFFTGMPIPSRGLFIIDPNKVVAMKSFNSWSVGMNTNHLLETIDYLQSSNEPKKEEDKTRIVKKDYLITYLCCPFHFAHQLK